MSDYNQYCGKLTPVESKGDVELTAKYILETEYYNNKPVELDENSYCDSYIEMLYDEGYKEYVLYKDVWYKVDKEEIDPYNDVFELFDNNDGSYNFVVKYYNGGCCFDEAIKQSFKKFRRLI